MSWITYIYELQPDHEDFDDHSFNIQQDDNQETVLPSNCIISTSFVGPGKT